MWENITGEKSKYKDNGKLNKNIKIVGYTAW